MTHWEAALNGTANTMAEQETKEDAVRRVRSGESTLQSVEDFLEIMEDCVKDFENGEPAPGFTVDTYKGIKAAVAELKAESEEANDAI